MDQSFHVGLWFGPGHAAAQPDGRNDPGFEEDYGPEPEDHQTWKRAERKLDHSEMERAQHNRVDW